MNSLENPWAATDEQLANPWEFGNGRSVLEKGEYPKPKAEYKPFSTPKGRIVFENAKALENAPYEDEEIKKGCIFVNLNIVFYGTGINENVARQQATYLQSAMNELCHYTTGPDGSIYRVMYRVQGEYDNTETSVKKRMAGNAKINYDDRLCFARIQPSLKGGPHNDDKKNDNGAGTTTGVGNSFIAGKEHLSTTSLTHEIIAHFFWGRGEGTKSHLSNWAENPRQEGPPSIRMICEDGGDIINVPIKFNINGESTCFDKTTRKVLPEDKITLTKKDWLNALYIKNGIPTNTFFNKNVEQIPVSTFNK